jgi:hypothetical protein
MQIVYTRKPKIHMLQKGKAVCGRHWLDGEEEGSKFANLVDCKDCLRLLTPHAPDGADRAATESGLYNCQVCGFEKCRQPGICEECLTPPTESEIKSWGVANAAPQVM